MITNRKAKPLFLPLRLVASPLETKLTSVLPVEFRIMGAASSLFTSLEESSISCQRYYLHFGIIHFFFSFDRCCARLWLETTVTLWLSLLPKVRNAPLRKDYTNFNITVHWTSIVFLTVAIFVVFIASVLIAFFRFGFIFSLKFQLGLIYHGRAFLLRLAVTREGLYIRFWFSLSENWVALEDQQEILSFSF